MAQDKLDNELIDKLLGNYQKPEDLIGENGLLKRLTKAPRPGQNTPQRRRGMT
jgi:hypothetical protein